MLVYRLIVSHSNVPYWTHQPLEHTGSLPNIYINVLNEQEYDDLEHDFDKYFESPSKPSFDKLCNGEKLTSYDWRKISDYVVAQYVRTPAFYIWIKELGKRIIPEQIDALAKELNEMKTIPNNRHRGFDEDSLLPLRVQLTDIKPDKEHTYIEITSSAGKGMWLFAIKHVLQEDSELRKYFRNLKWSIITAPEGEDWPSCDNPVVICEISGNTIERALASAGIVGKTRAIIFPVSPKKLLLGMTRRKFPWRMIADDQLFEQIKTVIVNNAFMFVYHNHEDEAIVINRPRVVDEQEYKRVNQEFNTWFDNYKIIEGPLLRR